MTILMIVVNLYKMYKITTGLGGYDKVSLSVVSSHPPPPLLLHLSVYLPVCLSTCLCEKVGRRTVYLSVCLLASTLDHCYEGIRWVQVESGE